MPSLIKLIVGLGNPGLKYQQTRHNAGVWFVEKIIRLMDISLRYEAKFLGAHGLGTLNAQDFHLLVPTTFMNNSGQAVKAVATFYKIDPEAILIVHDEIDLPTGTVRLKFDGGNGGHNGLKDIINHLHTKQFSRLRIGVGRPTLSHEVQEYVLSSPNKLDHEKIQLALEQACNVLPLLLVGELQKAMQQLHS